MLKRLSGSVLLSYVSSCCYLATSHRRRGVVLLISVLLATTTSTAMAVASCPFDNGGSDALNDGVVLTRYALGIAGAPMIASTRYASLDPLQVKANIECVGCALDMNGDGQIDYVDTTIIARHLAGFTGASLTAGLALGSGTRPNLAAVTSFLVNGCGTTGGTITSIATSAGILGGPITSSGTLSADTTYLQRRVASNCAAGSAINAIAADGTVSCAVTGQANAFVQGGNSFGAPGVLGTNDAQPLTVKSGGTAINLVNQRGDGLRVSSSSSSTAPNTINGHGGNGVTAGVRGATVGGGGDVPFSTVSANVVSGNYGTISGGVANLAADFAVVAGGNTNSASNTGGVVSGGFQNAAPGFYGTIAGGGTNFASGDYSTVAGGANNSATGKYSFAAGAGASADKDGAFVWADHTLGTPFTTSANWAAGFGTNTFSVRATGGVMFATSTNASGVAATYCYMGASGTGWICTSDRNVKERIEPITPSHVLAGVLAMPVSTWSIIGSKVRQMGPMAQDFYRAFGLGETDKAINSIDVGGVAFAAIQGLNEKLSAQLRTKDSEIAKLKAALAERSARHDARLAAIEKRLGL